MQSWRGPKLPSLDARRFGFGPDVTVFDTATSSLVRTSPGEQALLYVCGITPYDATHLGHAATCVAFDLLVRAWRDARHDVTYVQNITDVDDPLLERAQATGEDWQALAERETELFRTDMAALRLLSPEHYVGAVESIPLIVDLIGRLASRGALYELDGDWYFAVSADPDFGSVSGLARPAMLEAFGERGGDPGRPGKKDPLDCLVWQSGRPGEPSWESPLGRGRPGWHIECTAIALRFLGLSFDVQGGGSDLAFPHHEMCAAEAEVACGQRPFAQAYVHAGMVGLDGRKMSKSKGNLVLVSTLREQGHDPMAIRLALLGHWYRHDWDWRPEDLTAAQSRLDHWRAAMAAPRGASAQPVVDGVRAALADDLDAPGALAVVDTWARATLAGSEEEADSADAVRVLCDARLGVAV